MQLQQNTPIILSKNKRHEHCGNCNQNDRIRSNLISHNDDEVIRFQTSIELKERIDRNENAQTKTEREAHRVYDFDFNFSIFH